MRRFSAVHRLARALVLVLFCCATVGLQAQESPVVERDGFALERQVARALVDLDRRLDLGTFPDGSGLWTARLAAALDRRGNGSVLMLRLARQLDGLDVERPLDAPVVGPGAETLREPPSDERVARLEAVLDTVRLLEGKLDAAAFEPPAVSPAALPANDSCAAAAVVAVETVSGTTTGASTGGTASCGASDGSPSVWYRFTAADRRVISFDTLGAGFDTVLSLHSACPGEAGAVELACNDDAGDAIQSRITRLMETGDEVWVRVSGYEGAAGDFELTIEETPGISGTVTREGNGAALSKVRVSLLDGAPPYASGDLVETTETAADGTFHLGALGEEPYPGPYYLIAEDDDFLDELYDDIPCAFFRECYPLHQSTLVSPPASGVEGGYDFVLERAGGLAGTVTDTVSGDGLQGFVHLYSVEGYRRMTVETEADGSFRLGSLPPGDYRVSAEAAGYQSEVFEEMPCPSLEACSLSTGTLLTVTAGPDQTGIDFTLLRLGSIAGQLTAESSGVPLANARVVVVRGGDFYVASARTDEDGHYEVLGVPEGSFYLRTDLYSDFQNEIYDDLVCVGYCDATTGTAVDVFSDQATSGIDFALQRFGVLTGQVTETGSGAPVQSAHVTVYDGDGDYVRARSTNSQGVYRIEELPAGTYTVRAQNSEYVGELWQGIPCEECDVTTGTPVSVALDETVSGIDFQLGRRGQIAGTVAFKRGRVQGAYDEVEFYDTDGRYVSYTYVELDGSFLSRPLPAGSYYVRVSSQSHRDEIYPDIACSPSTCPVTSGILVPVADGEITPDIDLILDRLGILEVRGLAADSGQPLDGYVAVYDREEQRRASGSTSYSTRTAQIFGLNPARYYVHFSHDSYQGPYQDVLWRGVPCDPFCDLTQGRLVRVTLNGDIVSLDLELQKCPHDTADDQSGKLWRVTEVHEACDVVTSSGSTVESGADVTFRTGRAVVLGDGFVVEDGGSFRVEIVPEWSGESP